MTHSASRCLLPLIGIVALGGALMPAREAHAAPDHASPIYLSALQNFHPVLTRNFNPFTPTSAMDFTLGGIYEPLAVVTPAGGGHTYPWLASSWKYSDGNKTLTLTARHGVRWSDGVPFTAKDLLFTFTYGRVNATADQIGLTNSPASIASVNLVGSDQVAVHYNSVNTVGLSGFLSGIKIVPEHIWAKIKNPDTYTNPNPVGTGPFTQVLNFSGQGFILGKNPYYWQPGRPAFDGIKLAPYLGNDSANTAMTNGELDWTDNLVPNIQQVYVNKDPQHYHYYYDTHQPPNGLFFNLEKYPYSLPAFRKALSYAIDRQRIDLVAENGYENPANVVAIGGQFPNWVDKTLLPQATDLSSYNQAKARAALVAAGFKYNGGNLFDPRGHRVSFQLQTPNSFSDFIIALRILTKDFQDIGIDASYKAINEGLFYDKANKGLLDGEMYWTNSGFSPYDFYEGYMSKESYIPTGEDSTVHGQFNYMRYKNPRADALLRQFRQTTDTATQRSIIYKLERIQVNDMPFIPLVAAALWYTYSTKNFVGWPTEQNSYVYGQPVLYPDDVKVLTTITPTH